jgi:hypothetical protein
MSTTESHGNADQSLGARPQTPRSMPRRLTAGDWARGLLFLATVLAFAAGAFLIFALVFGVFFNAYTIHLTIFAFGLLAFLHGFTEYRNRLAARGTATATASSAAIGLVELSGRGYVEHPSEAPVTKTPCAFWRVEVRHRGQKDFRLVASLWHRVMERSSGALDTLELEDDSGRILVWTRGAEMIPITQAWRSDRGGDPPEGVLKLIAALGLQWPSRWARYPMKVTEERIEQGGPLYVMGTLAERRQIPAVSRGRFATLLDKWAPSSLEVTPQQANSFSATFDYARKLGLRWVAKDVRALAPEWSPPAVDQHQVLVWKGEQRRPFVISGVLERQALTALSRRAWAYLLGGAAVMAWMLWEFLEKLAGNMHW